MKPIHFHRLARREMLEASDFYDHEVEGLGEAFLSAVERVLGQLTRYPESGTPLQADLRRAIVPGFPYSLIYADPEEKVYILALAHQKRRPRYWADRLS